MRQSRLSAALIALAMSGPIWAQTVVPMPVECGARSMLFAMLEEYDERPMMTFSSVRMIRQAPTIVPTVLFVNPVTTTWSLVEQVSDDVYCVVAQGDQAKSYRDPGGI